MKRGQVPLEEQHLIMVVENVAPVHHQCHMQHGQAPEMSRRCLLATVHMIGIARVLKWYTDLWRTYGLAVPKGDVLQAESDPLGYLLNIIGG